MKKASTHIEILFDNQSIRLEKIVFDRTLNRMRKKLKFFYTSAHQFEDNIQFETRQNRLKISESKRKESTKNVSVIKTKKTIKPKFLTKEKVLNQIYKEKIEKITMLRNDVNQMQDRLKDERTYVENLLCRFDEIESYLILYEETKKSCVKLLKAKKLEAKKHQTNTYLIEF